MSTNNPHNVEEILRRLMFVKKFDTFQEIADFLEVDNKALSAWKTRNSRIAVQKISTKCSDLDLNWLLRGKGLNGHVANGNNIIQGAHIDAEDVHLTVHQPGGAADPGYLYADPINTRFLQDWKSLSETGQMRVWTLLKEEMDREKGKGKK